MYICVAVTGRNPTLFCCIFNHVTTFKAVEQTVLLRGGEGRGERGGGGPYTCSIDAHV